MADQDHPLACCHLSVVFDDCFEKLDQCIGRIGLPVLGLKIGETTAREVHGETRGYRSEAGEQSMKLGDRSSKAMNEDQERDRRWRGR
jgi:hypothetical protein